MVTTCDMFLKGAPAGTFTDALTRAHIYPSICMWLMQAALGANSDRQVAITRQGTSPNPKPFFRPLTVAALTSAESQSVAARDSSTALQLRVPQHSLTHTHTHSLKQQQRSAHQRRGQRNLTESAEKKVKPATTCLSRIRTVRKKRGACSEQVWKWEPLKVPVMSATGILPLSANLIIKQIL